MLCQYFNSFKSTFLFLTGNKDKEKTEGHVTI